MSAILRRSALMAALLLGARPGPAQDTPGPGLDPLRDVGIDQRLGERLPLELAFRNELGRTVQLGEFFDEKPVVLAFVYYRCPMLCTLVLNGLLRCLRALPFDTGEEFQVVLVSIDPKEGPDLAQAKKAAYLEQYGREGTEGGWHFLTGDQRSIAALTSACGFRYVYQEEIDEYAHGSGILVATPDGVLSHYFYGVEYSARELRLALREASDGRVGSIVDAFLLLCYHYDPRTGRYGIAIMNATRAAGGLTVLLLGGLIVFLVHRERRGAIPAG
jgi:protein SCO1/2